MTMRDPSPCPYCNCMTIGLPVFNIFGEQVYPCKDCTSIGFHNQYCDTNYKLEKVAQSRRQADALWRISQQLETLTCLLKQKI